jgi:hypothetical protein
MSEIFRSHQESPYPYSENTWPQELGSNDFNETDHRWNSLPYDRAYSPETSTLPDGFEEVTEIEEVNETAPDQQPNTSWKKMNDEEVARARELVASMFNGRSSQTK